MANNRPAPHGPGRRGFGKKPDLKSMNSGKILRRIMGYVSGIYRVQFVIVLIAILFSSLATVASSLFLRPLIDDYITPLIGQASPDFGPLLRVLLMMCGVYALGMLSTYLYNRLMINVSQGVLKQVRDEMFAHMQKLPIKYFDTHAHGEIMSRFTNDTDTLRQMISQSIPNMFSSAVTLVSVFVSMVILSWQLTLLLIVMLVLMTKATQFIGGRSGRYFVEQQEKLGKVNGYIEEMMNGQKVVKVFCHEAAAEERFNELNDELCDAATRANRFANILMPIMANLGNLQYVLTAIVGGALAVSGLAPLSLGDIASFLQLTKSFTMPFTQISQQLNAVIMAMAGANRIFQLMDELPEEDNGYVTLVNAKYNEQGELYETPERTGIWAWKHPHKDGTLTYARVRGEVRFYDVDFGYTEDKIVLQNITLYAKPGQKIAFVGSTGAGKTTITNLINRFYDLADGKIRFDDININKIRKPDLRRALGIVLQDTHLFTGTVMENIRYGKLDAADEDVYAAARLANADGFIRRLPQGYDTMLTSDGEGLSQGQRQLLAIARAAVADPPVLILDVATSSIDTRTEQIVQQGMDRLMEGRTVFVIAHRLSTVRNSNAIMVLEHGKIIERGEHDDLIAEKGKYYQLYTGALELS